MKVVCTESSQILGARIADSLGAGLVDVKFTRFPDGELYLRTGPLDGETVIVGSVTSPEAFVQLVLLVDACDSSWNRLVVPYMGYARQDKRFQPGEPLSARAVAKVLSRGVAELFSVNIHDEGVLCHFEVPAVNLSLATDLGRYIGGMDLEHPLILAPDDGASAFAREVAAAGGWDSDHLDKTRLSGEEVRMAEKTIDASGRDVVIVDDIISTGGTISTAAGLLYQQGAKNVHAACVHGVLAGGAYARLRAAGVRDVACSDTCERGCSRYSAAQAIAAALRSC
ncbi:MAG: ribose-phosphate diphosphokinase [Methanoregulaceae archaeon]|nr:ribose-phosphate diphosphokinase [Methanoregulaceae archaeon]